MPTADLDALIGSYSKFSELFDLATVNEPIAPYRVLLGVATEPTDREAVLRAMQPALRFLQSLNRASRDGTDRRIEVWVQQVLGCPKTQAYLARVVADKAAGVNSAGPTDEETTIFHNRMIAVNQLDRLAELVLLILATISGST